MSDVGMLRRMAKMPSDFIFSENKEHKVIRFVFGAENSV